MNTTATDIISAYEELEESLRVLCVHLHNELLTYPVWVDDGEGQLIAERSRLGYALTHFRPTAGLSPQETFACVGAVGGTEVSLGLIDAVNLAKDSVKEKVGHYLKQLASKHRDTAIIRDILAHHGYPGIKLKQVYRHIKYLRFHPRRVSFTQTEHSSNKTIDRQTAEQLLQEAGQGKHIAVQQAKMSALGAQDTLVIRRAIHQCWLVNVASFKDAQGRSSFSKVWTSLPLFYLHQHALPLPQVAFSQKYQRHKQAPRADKRVENTPFIASIHAYRRKVVILPKNKGA